MGWYRWAALIGLLACIVGSNAAVDPSKVRKIPLRSHSLSSPFLDSEISSRFFEFGEDTIVRTDQYVRLTSDRPSQDGWLFSRLPLTATNWMIEVEFKIHGAGHLHGDGMAIWVTEDRASPGPVFGHKDYFKGLGVFIDTYKNHRPGTVFPYVMAMLGNGTEKYDKDNDGKDSELAGCSARGIRGASIPTKLRMTYYQEQSFKVELQYKSADEWTDCFEVGAIKLPPVTYLGFSGETGELTDNHDIIQVSSHNMHISEAWKNSENTDRGARRTKGKGYDPNRGRQGGGWVWFFLKLLLIPVIAVGGYVGWTAYRSSKRGSRF